MLSRVVFAAGFTDAEFRCHDGTGGGLWDNAADFARDFKREAVKLVRERGVSIA